MAGGSGIGAAIGGGLLSSGLSAMTNFIGANAQNYRAVRMMREQNDFNAREAQKNRDYQTDMWNKTNEYNSPVEMMKRFRDAGLNPYLMMGNAGVSQAQAMQGTPTSSSQTPSIQQANSVDFSPISNAFSQLADQSFRKPQRDSEIDANNADTLKKTAEAEKANTEEKIAREEWLIRHPLYGDLLKTQMDRDWSAGQESLSNARLSNTRSRNEMFMFPYEQQYKQALTDFYGEQAARSRAEAVLVNLKQKEQEIFNKYLPTKLQAEIGSLLAQGKEAEANALVAGVTANLKGAELELFNDTYDSVRRKIKAQNHYFERYYSNDGAKAWYNEQFNSQVSSYGKLVDAYDKVNPVVDNGWKFGPINWHNYQRSNDGDMNPFGRMPWDPSPKLNLNALDEMYRRYKKSK